LLCNNVSEAGAIVEFETKAGHIVAAGLPAVVELERIAALGFR